MRIGLSLFLIAAGAILRFAVTDHVKGVNLGVVGVVLMIVGALGLILEAAVAAHRRRDVVVHEQAYAEPPTTVRRY